MGRQLAVPRLDATMTARAFPPSAGDPPAPPTDDRRAAAAPDADLHPLLDEAIAALLASGADLGAFWSWAQPLDRRLLPLLAPIARRLGDLWMEDVYGFCDVTVVMHRLTLLLIELESREAPGIAAAAHGRAILLAPASDDQHGFGLALLAVHLRQAGWDVTADVAAHDVVAAVSRRRFAAVGLSVGHDRAIDAVADTVRAVRDRSLDRHVLVALGGPMLNGRPGLARALGADLWADEPAELVDKLRHRAALI